MTIEEAMTSHEDLPVTPVYLQDMKAAQLERDRIEKPHVCPTCGLRYKNRGGLTEHGRVKGHYIPPLAVDGNAPREKFPCPHCPKQFSHRDGRRAHLRAEHGYPTKVRPKTKYLTAEELKESRRLKAMKQREKKKEEMARQALEMLAGLATESQTKVPQPPPLLPIAMPLQPPMNSATLDALIKENLAPNNAPAEENDDKSKNDATATASSYVFIPV